MTRITGSPRLRLRLAQPQSQARLDFHRVASPAAVAPPAGCGSHSHNHRLASIFTGSPRLRLWLRPRAAARTATNTGTPRLSHDRPATPRTDHAGPRPRPDADSSRP